MSNELAHDLSPLIKVYKDGRVERLTGTTTVPASLDPKTGVHSNDVVISHETGVSARIYIPKPAATTNLAQRLPLLVYFHRGCFCIETAASPTYHNYLNSLAAQANAIIVSVDYRNAPEHPLPAAYDDSWEALTWVASHSGGKGPDGWLNTQADFRGGIFLAGDSAGANMAHNMAVRVGVEGLGDGVELGGVVLVQPYFSGVEPIGDEVAGKAAGVKKLVDAMWQFTYPTSTGGSDDPLMNPAKDPNLGRLGRGRVLVCVAEKDGLKDRGLYYSEVLLENSEWEGRVEVMETKGEDHIFHLLHPTCDNALDMMSRICTFLDQ